MRSTSWLVTVLAAVTVGLAWARRRWLVVTVVGDSMSDTFPDGARVLARQPASALRPGDLIIFRSPSDPIDKERLIKRVVAVAGDVVPDSVRAAVAARPFALADVVPVALPERVPAGTVLVLGDQEGYDSRVFGPLPVHFVQARVVRRLRVGPAPVPTEPEP